MSGILMKISGWPLGDHTAFASKLVSNEFPEKI